LLKIKVNHEQLNDSVKRRTAGRRERKRARQNAFGRGNENPPNAFGIQKKNKIKEKCHVETGGIAVGSWCISL
jgi:hypothetical protein